MQIITHRGWNHFGCGPWTSTISVPEGWRVVARGKTRATDRWETPTKVGHRKSKRPRAKNLLPKAHTIIPTQWEIVGKEGAGLEVKTCWAVIRKVTRKGMDGN